MSTCDLNITNHKEGNHVHNGLMFLCIHKINAHSHKILKKYTHSTHTHSYRPNLGYTFDIFIQSIPMPIQIRRGRY